MTSFNAALSGLMPTPLGSHKTERGNVFLKEVDYHVNLPALRSSLTQLQTSAQNDLRIQTFSPEMQQKIREIISQIEFDIYRLDGYMNQTMPGRVADLKKDLSRAREEQSEWMDLQTKLIIELSAMDDYAASLYSGVGQSPLDFKRDRLANCQRTIDTLKKRIFMLENVMNYTDGKGSVHFATDDDWMLNSGRIPPNGYSETTVAYKITYHYDVKEGENEVRVEVTPLHIPNGAPIDDDTKTEMSMLKSLHNPSHRYLILKMDSQSTSMLEEHKERFKKELAVWDEKCTQKATATKVVNYCRKTTLNGIPSQWMDTLVSHARRLSELYNAPVSNNNNAATTTISNNNAEPTPAVPATLSQPAALAWPKTPVTVKCNAGWGKALYVYGTGADGMSWEKGIKMNCSNGDTWSVELPSNGTNLSFKIVLQDEKGGKLWESGSNHDVKAGQKVSIDSLKFKA